MSLETVDTSVKIEPVIGNDAATKANQAAELAAAKARPIARIRAAADSSAGGRYGPRHRTNEGNRALASMHDSFT